jgi:cytochrome c-type biogenesis protein
MRVKPDDVVRAAAPWVNCEAAADLPDERTMSLDVSIGAALVAGAISFLSPCVLPLVPPYLCFITGTSLEELVDHKARPQEERRRTLLAALMFVLGFSTVFIILGASASWLGGMLRTELARQIEILGFSFNPITTLAGQLGA